jgi:colanic acid/amylovoran biosynthesis protein
MKILIINGYVRENKGDAAQLSVLCSELQKQFDEAVITISSQEDPIKHPKFESWNNIGSFTCYFDEPNVGKPRKALRIALCIVAPLLVSSKYNSFKSRVLPRYIKKQISAIQDSDLIVSVGGGYLGGAPGLSGTIWVYLTLLPMIIAVRQHKCTACAPQSIVTFRTKLQKRLARKTLSSVNLILTREDVTKRLLLKLGLENNVKSSVDSGFLFKSSLKTSVRTDLNIPRDNKVVGITVRKWLNENKQREYEKAIAKTIDYITAKDKISVIFIPDTTSYIGGDDDRITSLRVYKNIKNKQHVHILENDYDHYQIKAIYDELDFIIGTRFHSVILSLTGYVPALAIGYEHKTRGIMHDLGLDEWVIKIEDVTAANLIDKTNELIASRAEYKAYLHKVLPPYIMKAHEAVKLIGEAYKASLDK